LSIIVHPVEIGRGANGITKVECQDDTNESVGERAGEESDEEDEMKRLFISHWL
jgi:hypothetical protein